MAANSYNNYQTMNHGYANNQIYDGMLTSGYK